MLFIHVPEVLFAGRTYILVLQRALILKVEGLHYRSFAGRQLSNPFSWNSGSLLYRQPFRLVGHLESTHE